jgi:hypothetical protein
MTRISIEPARKTVNVLPLIRSAVDSEIARLKLAYKMTMKRLLPFEEKYGVTSEYFITEMAAEDLEGKDEEYIRWAGEYMLMQRLLEKLQKLQEVDYDDSGILSPDEGRREIVHNSCSKQSGDYRFSGTPRTSHCAPDF